MKWCQRSFLAILLSEFLQFHCLSSRLPLTRRLPNLFCLCRVNVGLYNFERRFVQKGFLDFPLLTLASGVHGAPQTHFRCTFTSLLFSAFIQQIASHGLQSGTALKRHRGGRERKRKKSNLDRSLVNLQTFFQGAYLL